MLESAVITPAEVMDAIVVAPYLNSNFPPDSTIEKFVVATEPALPVVFWFNVGTSAAWMVFITTFVPLPRR
jgi:hypothetical protein